MSGPKHDERAGARRRYRPYPAYKDSGVEWLGEIPAGWALKKLAWLTDCLDGRRVPLNSEERGVMQGDYPYWGANSIVDYVDRWLFDEELVLLGEDGAPFFDRSKSVAFRVSGRIWVNNHAHVLRPKRSLDAAFLAHALNCVDYRAFIDGTTRDKLTQGDMNSIAVQLPPLGEQRAIADFLDRETARIDALVAKKERLIELLQEQRTALITRAVTKGLDPTVPMKDSGVEWLGEIPAHWEVRRIRHVVESVKNGTTANQLEYGETEYCVTRIESISNGTIDLSKVGFVEWTPELDEYRLEKGDLLLSHINSISMLGNCALYDLDFPLYGGMNLLRLRPSPVVQGRWLWNWMRSEFGRESVRSRCKPAINQASVPIGALKNMAMCVPPPSDQDSIAAFLDRETARIDALVAKVRDAIDRLKELRVALISAAVTGKIDVREGVA